MIFAVLLPFLRRIVIGLWPDFLKLMTGKWDHVKWDNLMSEWGGKNNWDKVRLVANFAAPFVNLFLLLLFVEVLIALGIIPQEMANEVRAFLGISVPGN